MPDLNFEMGVLGPVDHSQMRLKGQYTPAAVLVLIFKRNREPCILLTKRTLNVRHHKGEISFPGGRMDKGDGYLLNTAIRETFEEIGINVSEKKVLGQLKDSPTTSGYMIRPFVAALEYPYNPVVSSGEVSEILEMPLEILLDDAKWRDESRISDNRLKSSLNYVFDGHVVHGATARILTDLSGMIGSLSDL